MYYSTISLVMGRGFSSQNSPKDLVPSHKIDLDLWYCFGKGKTGIKNVELLSCLEYFRGGKSRLIAEENAVVLNH